MPMMLVTEEFHVFQNDQRPGQYRLVRIVATSCDALVVSPANVYFALRPTETSCLNVERNVILGLFAKSKSLDVIAAVTVPPIEEDDVRQLATSSTCSFSASKNSILKGLVHTYTIRRKFGATEITSSHVGIS
jgi:hypothetical protein